VITFRSCLGLRVPNPALLVRRSDVVPNAAVLRLLAWHLGTYVGFVIGVQDVAGMLFTAVGARSYHSPCCRTGSGYCTDLAGLLGRFDAAGRVPWLIGDAVRDGGVLLGIALVTVYWPAAASSANQTTAARVAGRSSRSA